MEQVVEPAAQQERAWCKDGVMEMEDAVEGQAEGRMLGPKEVAALFDVSAKTVLNWAKAGRIPSVPTPSGRLCFPADELHEIVARQWSPARQAS